MRSYGLVVMTPLFHSGDRGSIPLTTIQSIRRFTSLCFTTEFLLDKKKEKEVKWDKSWDEFKNFAVNLMQVKSRDLKEAKDSEAKE